VELELELTQTHMTQKPLLWVEVGAHAVRKRKYRHPEKEPPYQGYSAPSGLNQA
jgi:hypothetical protein